MKKLLLVLSSILLLASSCQKQLSKGLYFADTEDGIIYLELMKGKDCIMFFQGEKEESCTYYISDGQIDLMGHATININGYTNSWWFGGSLGKGIINGDSFKIQAQRMCKPGLEYKYLTFYKH